MAQFLVMLRPKRPTYMFDMTEAERAVMAEHSAYMQQLLEAGTLIITGPCTDGAFGLSIIEVEDEAAARRVVAGDPAVRADVGTLEMHPFHVARMRGS
jgi:uncharacterized protein YciI